MHNLEKLLLDLAEVTKRLASMSQEYLPHPNNAPELGEGGKGVYCRFGFWLESDGSVHLTAPDIPGFHVIVNQDSESPKGHPELFARLTDCLHANGAPAPAPAPALLPEVCP